MQAFFFVKVKDKRYQASNCVLHLYDGAECGVLSAYWQGKNIVNGFIMGLNMNFNLKYFKC